MALVSIVPTGITVLLLTHCVRLFRGDRKRKRGNISASRTQKHSAKRMTTMFAVEEQPVECAYRHGFDSRPIESISKERKDEIYSMVSSVITMRP